MPPTEYASGWAVQGACSSATEALLARQDGCIHAGAGQLLQEYGDAEAEAQQTYSHSEADVLRGCRRILLQLTMIKVCYPAFVFLQWPV